jgi:hypothetical protein
VVIARAGSRLILGKLARAARRQVSGRQAGCAMNAMLQAEVAKRSFVETISRLLPFRQKFVMVATLGQDGCPNFRTSRYIGPAASIGWNRECGWRRTVTPE